MWRPRAIRRSWSTSKKSWGRASELMGLTWRGTGASMPSEGGKGHQEGTHQPKRRLQSSLGLALLLPTCVPLLRGGDRDHPVSWARREAEVLGEHWPWQLWPVLSLGISLWSWWVSSFSTCWDPSFVHGWMEQREGSQEGTSWRKHVEAFTGPFILTTC